MKKIILIILLTFVIGQVYSQRMRHGASRSMSRPTSQPSNRSINGGNYKAPNRNQPSAGQRPSNPSINTGDRNTNINNKRGDVNINIDNSRNTVVRKNNVAAYHRPPYMYGGRAFYCHNPYFYHAYRPFYWGPAYHPWGFFIAALAVTAIIVSVNDQQYQYDEGTWYSKADEGYTVVQAPVGGTVTKIPPGNQTVVVNNVTNYYYAGAYYEKTKDGYKVVPPPAGAVVDNLPEGGEEVKIGDQTYVKVGETYYQPIQVDGKNKYEVVQIEEEKKK